MHKIDDREIIVVGCGVNGLTCGITLLRQYPVKILAHKLPPDTTSNAAGAFWEPYKAYPMDKVIRWSKASLVEYNRLAMIEGSGVSMTTLVEGFKDKLIEPAWKDAVDSFKTCAQDELPHGYKYGYAARVPKMDTTLYMPFLLDAFKKSGGEVVQLDQPLKSLAELYKSNRIIINCTGLGSRDLCSDSDIFPIRGQVTLLSRPPELERIFMDEHDYVLIMPRTNDCVLGFSAHDNDWNLNFDEKMSAETIERCCKVIPELRRSQITGHKVGLRPGRSQVRLEVERVSDSCAVIHNYGHGGAGFTLSWGCAQEVAEQASNLLNGSTLRLMTDSAGLI